MLSTTDGECYLRTMDISPGLTAAAAIVQLPALRCGMSFRPRPVEMDGWCKRSRATVNRIVPPGLPVHARVRSRGYGVAVASPPVLVVAKGSAR